MSCQKDQYLLGIYSLVTSIAVMMSGILVLFALGDLKPEEDAERKQKLEATNISITSPLELPQWQKFSLNI